jgi:hypothetical protein
VLSDLLTVHDMMAPLSGWMRQRIADVTLEYQHRLRAGTAELRTPEHHREADERAAVGSHFPVFHGAGELRPRKISILLIPLAGAPCQHADSTEVAQ